MYSKIKAEIERLIKNPRLDEEYNPAYQCGLRDLRSFIGSLEKEQPQGLDEAAEEVLENYDAGFKNIDDDGGSESLFDMQQMLAMFKAGAEWMAGQGIKLHGRILPGPKCNLYIESDCFDRGYKGLNYKFSESNDVDMFVQIRKAK